MIDMDVGRKIIEWSDKQRQHELYCNHDFVKFKENGCTDDREYFECKHCRAYFVLGDTIRTHDGIPLRSSPLILKIIKILGEELRC